MALPDQPVQNPDAAVLAQSLAKLWPHREHESNCWKNLMCWVGLHRWAQLDLSQLAPAFCTAGRLHQRVASPISGPKSVPTVTRHWSAADLPQIETTQSQPRAHAAFSARPMTRCIARISDTGLFSRLLPR
jgi:hypothetical protein